MVKQTWIDLINQTDQTSKGLDLQLFTNIMLCISYSNAGIFLYLLYSQLNLLFDSSSKFTEYECKKVI